MFKFAVAIFDLGTTWIEFYEADDSTHAKEQAMNANPGALINCVAMVPYA